MKGLAHGYLCVCCLFLFIIQNAVFCPKKKEKCPWSRLMFLSDIWWLFWTKYIFLIFDDCSGALETTFELGNQAYLISFLCFQKLLYYATQGLFAKKMVIQLFHVHVCTHMHMYMCPCTCTTALKRRIKVLSWDSRDYWIESASPVWKLMPYIWRLDP